MINDILKYQPVRFFPELYNIDDFVEEHPIIDPEAQGAAYNEYYQGVLKKIIEGKWGHDYNPETKMGGWRYQTPICYTYINAWVIDMEEGDGSKMRKLERPKLMDIVWIHTNALHVAKGYSGFENDPDYTCLYAVERIEKKETLTSIDELTLRHSRNHIFKADGSYKKFVEPYTYLCKTHERPLGPSLYFNEAQNLINIQSRRGGKSNIGACAAYHEFLTLGKKRFDSSYTIAPRGTNSTIIASIKDKSEKLCKMILDGADYLNNTLGSYKGSPGYFRRSTYGSLAQNDTMYHGVKITKKVNRKVSHETKTTGASISHLLATVQNPDVGAGGAQAFDVLEEFGLFKNAKAVLKTLEPAQTGTLKNGFTFAIGTGGNVEKIQESKEIMENPRAFKAVCFKDLTENRTNPIGLFLPSYMTRYEYKDSKGNTMLEAAFRHEIEEILKIIETGDRQSLELHLQAYPLVLSHVYLGSKGSHFPTTYILPALQRMDVTQFHKIVGTVGTITMTNHVNREVVFTPDLTGKIQPIYHYNTNNYANKDGGVTIYEPPELNLEYERFSPKVYFNPYKTVYDTIKDPMGGDSLAVIYVFKSIGNDLNLMTNTIVASYIGRLDNPNDIDQIAINMAIMYGSRILYEQNTNTILTYAQAYGYEDLLQPTPYDSIKNAIKSPKGKYQTGLHMSTPLKLKADIWWSAWLVAFRNFSETGEKRYNVDYLCCRRLLEEHLFYESDKNFDCISTVRLWIVWMQQELQPSEEIKEELKQLAKQNSKMYESVPNTGHNGSVWAI